MKSKAYVAKSGACVIFEQLTTGAQKWYSVVMRNASGELLDKVRCDTYADACAYCRSFRAIIRA